MTDEDEKLAEQCLLDEYSDPIFEEQEKSIGRWSFFAGLKKGRELEREECETFKQKAMKLVITLDRRSEPDMRRLTEAEAIDLIVETEA